MIRTLVSLVLLSQSAPIAPATPSEKHSTIYHPAALRAFRALFKP